MNTRNNITPEQIRKINADTQEIEKFRKVSMLKLQKNDFQSAQMFFSLLSAAASRCSDTLSELLKEENDENDKDVSRTSTSKYKESTGNHDDKSEAEDERIADAADERIADAADERIADAAAKFDIGI